MDFDEVVLRTHAAIEQCLFESLSSKGIESRHPLWKSHARINKKFEFLAPFRNGVVNTFLTKEDLSVNHSALFKGHTKDLSKEPTRISRIVSAYLREAVESGKRTSPRIADPTEAYKFRSPWWVTEKLLTNPEAIETKEIARFRIKLQMLRQHSVSVALSRDDNQQIPTVVDFESIDRLYVSLQKYIDKRDSIPRPSKEDEHFLACFFSQYGLIDHRIFWPVDSKSTNKKTAILQGFSGGAEEFQKLVWETSEFRLNTSVKALPSIAELANRVFGLPLAISGLNDLINGGLRLGVGEGTVTLIRGGAGTGKTTLSISIQRAVEALGIPTLFLSTEESTKAIEARRESVLNLAQKSHSAYSKDSAPHKILTTVPFSDEKQADTPGIFSIVEAISSELARKDYPSMGPEQFGRMLLVVDGMHNYIHEQGAIRKLIDLCRSTGSHVLITSSDNWAIAEGMEYFVDNYFRLTSITETVPMPHVRRQISIIKTRHQSSMIGDHWMQFRDEGDLSFMPNFAETLRSQSKVLAGTADFQRYSHPFKIGKNERSKKQGVAGIKFYDRSVSLIYGRGSASKTALSYRLLATPNIEEENFNKRLLVVSFLSPDQYYKAHGRKIQNTIQKEFEADTDNFNVSVDTLFFTPGMVSAEEVYASIADRISNFDTKQSGYTGILIDGLHNVFVQFPLLEKHSELWSALLSLVRRVGIKTVLTYTDFEVWGASTLTTVDYENIRSKPLLIALSQSLDFGFSILPANQQGIDEREPRQGDMFPSVHKGAGKFIFSAFLAEGQSIPSDYLIWDRDTETFVG